MKNLLKKWKKWRRAACCLAAAAAFALAMPGVEAKEKVLLDADMVEMFDDGVAMMILERSAETELLGVTVVTGNTWAEDGVAFTIRQLEGMGATNIPVAMGEPRPETIERFNKIDEETKIFGRGHDAHMGAAGYARPENWQAAYRSHYGSSTPTFGPVDEAAEDMIIRTVKEHPDEVTIMAIGPCTNLAKALEKAPEIAPMAKRIVYMSGAFFQQGNVTPAAEFNVWIDPESAKKVMRAPWKEQIIVPLDACEKMRLTKEDFFGFKHIIKKPEFNAMMARHYLAERLENISGPTFIWDVLAAALIVDPSVILEEVTMPIDVNDVYSPSYGQTLAYIRVQPEGTQKARIIKTIDEKKVLWIIHDIFKTL